MSNSTVWQEGLIWYGMWPCHDNATRTYQTAAIRPAQRAGWALAGERQHPTWSAATKAALPPMLWAMAWACGTTDAMCVVTALSSETTEPLKATVQVS